MGPSGCGKSTTIRCINRLTEADEGQIIYRGQDLLKLDKTELLKLRQEIGFVFQGFNLIN
jgi:polar amino acid transport system ATP-binding protein